MLNIERNIERLKTMRLDRMYLSDFFTTWDKTDEELGAVLTVADALRQLRQYNRSCRIFDSGLAVSICNDPSMVTHFAFGFATNFLGLDLREVALDRASRQDHEAVRNIANISSFMADVIGVRDRAHREESHLLMRRIARIVQQSYEDRVLEQRPTLLNLQDSQDHPTQTMGDLFHLMRHFNGLEDLSKKKIAITWAYSPNVWSQSIPQGLIGLLTRVGMKVTLAHPPGYHLMPEMEAIAEKNAKDSGGSFTRTGSMEEAFQDADVVYPISWSPLQMLERKTSLQDKGNTDTDNLKKELFANNARYKNWECNEEMMRLTADQNALYMHALPADISGVNCARGGVSAEIYERNREPLFHQAGYKPYIIAAMVFLAKVRNPPELLEKLVERRTPRLYGDSMD